MAGAVPDPRRGGDAAFAAREGPGLPGAPDSARALALTGSPAVRTFLEATQLQVTVDWEGP